MTDENKTRSFRTLILPNLSESSTNIINDIFLKMLKFVFGNFTIKIFKSDLIHISNSICRDRKHS